MLEVEVRGFQSIEHVKLQIDGFTSLTGRSNIGKSAFVRAMKVALTNSGGVAFVRHAIDCARALRGAKTCKCQSSVHIVGEDFDLLWEKGDAVNRYVFNGNTYDKPGAGIPDFLMSSGFAPVKVGGSSVLIQVSDQFYPIFMLDQSGPAAAEAISDVASLGRVNSALRLVEKDRREAIATQKVRDKDLKEIQDHLTLYVDLDLDLSRVDAVVQQLATLRGKLRDIDELDGFILTLQGISDRLRTIWRISSVVTPESESISGPHLRLLKIQEFTSEVEKREGSLAKLLPLQELLNSTKLDADLTFGHKQVRQLSNWVLRLKDIKLKFASLERAGTTWQGVGAADLNLSALKQLQQFQVKLTTLQRSIADLEAQVSILDQVEVGLQAELDEIGACPTCLQAIHGEHHHA